MIVKPASIWQLSCSSGGWELRHSWFVKLALDFFECLHKGKIVGVRQLCASCF